jgi:SAM-dependent methyltransferase
MAEDEVPGFIRTERDADGAVTYPDMHGHFHWDAGSVTTRGRYVLAFQSCEHAACYVLTRQQLQKAIASGGYLVKPHEWEYDLLCTAATDPYTQCGFRKLVPISHIDQFSVEHLSNRYVGRLGVSAGELRLQLDALLDLSEAPAAPRLVFRTETRLRRRMYSKVLAGEPPPPSLLDAVGPGPGRLLSVGCGDGVIESGLIAAGWEVTGVPADPVVAVSAAARGVAVTSHDPALACQQLAGRTFDRIVAHQAFHLTPNPVGLIMTFAAFLAPGGTMVISLPNMWCYRDLPWNLRFITRYRAGWSYGRAGTWFTSAGVGRRWCDRAGLRVARVILGYPPRMMAANALVRGAFAMFAASDVILVAGRR